MGKRRPLVGRRFVLYDEWCYPPFFPEESMSKVADWQTRVAATEKELEIARKANKDGKYQLVVRRLEAVLKRQRETLLTYSQQEELFGDR